jgi:hypothetical protein
LTQGGNPVDHFGLGHHDSSERIRLEDFDNNCRIDAAFVRGQALSQPTKIHRNLNLIAGFHNLTRAFFATESYGLS